MVRGLNEWPFLRYESGPCKVGQVTKDEVPLNY